MFPGFRSARPKLPYASGSRSASVQSAIKEWVKNNDYFPSEVEDMFVTDMDVYSIFPYDNSLEGAASGGSSPGLLSWYRWWLDEKLKHVPPAFLELLPSQAPEEKLELKTDSQLMKVFLEIASYARSNINFSIDHIVHHLIEQDYLRNRTAMLGMQKYRTLVFAMLGWQTLLYTCAFGTAPPKSIAVVDEQNGFHGQAFIKHKVDHTTAKSTLHRFLSGFGYVFPVRNEYVGREDDERKAFEQQKRIEAAEFNAFLLNSVARVTITWVDTLAIHMELDKSQNVLYLFRYPSLCAASLPVNKDGSEMKSVLHSCAAPLEDCEEWAAVEDDVSEFLRETLLSFRLLFGQTKDSRKYFRCLKPFEGVPPAGQDTLLPFLCGKKNFYTSGLMEDKRSYMLSTDFPMLRARIVALQMYLADSKPCTWGELWRDKRDSAQWFTFWVVIIIGGLSLFLSFVQVILGILQILRP